MVDNMFIPIDVKDVISKDSKGKIVSISPLDRGMRSKVVKITCDTGSKYILKRHNKYTDDRGFSKFENEVQSLIELSKHGFSPEPLLFDQEKLLILSRFVPGRNLEEVLLANPNHDFSEIIALMRSVHHTCELHTNLFYRAPEDIQDAVELYRSYVGKDSLITAIDLYKEDIVKLLSSQPKHFILGDTICSNFVLNSKPFFVDAELCSNGPAVMDLCQLFTDAGLNSSQKKRLVGNYLGGNQISCFYEALDAASVYLNTFLLAIYTREAHTESGVRRDRTLTTIGQLRRDLLELVSDTRMAYELMRCK